MWRRSPTLDSWALICRLASFSILERVLAGFFTREHSLIVQSLTQWKHDDMQDVQDLVYPAIRGGLRA